jgi:hypothetical protein
MGLAACFARQTVLARATGWLVQLLGLGVLCWVVLGGLFQHLLQHLLVDAAQTAAAVAFSSLMQAAAVAAPEWSLTGPCLAPAAHMHGTTRVLQQPFQPGSPLASLCDAKAQLVVMDVHCNRIHPFTTSHCWCHRSRRDIQPCTPSARHTTEQKVLTCMLVSGLLEVTVATDLQTAECNTHTGLPMSCKQTCMQHPCWHLQ